MAKQLPARPYKPAVIATRYVGPIDLDVVLRSMGTGIAPGVGIQIPARFWVADMIWYVLTHIGPHRGGMR